MIYKIITAVCILALSVHAREFSFKSLHMPVFGDAGHLEQVLTAESGFGQFDRPVLKGGVIEFYTSHGKILDKGSRLTFEEATFVKADEVIEGDGLVRFQSPKGDLSGIGYTYDMKRRRLSLHSRVVANFERTEVTGDKAEVVIQKGDLDKKWSVADAMITGNVVASGFPTGGNQIERAETSQARYTGHDEVLVLTSPIHIWSNGKRAEASADELKIKLHEDPNNESISRASSD